MPVARGAGVLVLPVAQGAGKGSAHEHRSFENLRPRRNRGALVRALGGKRAFPPRTPRRRSLHDRQSAAQCDGIAPYRPCTRQHLAGHRDPLRTAAGQGCFVGGRHGPCRDRDADGGRASAGGRGRQADELCARGFRRQGVEMERGERRHHHAPAPPPRLFDGLEPRTVHHGRSFQPRRDAHLRAIAQGWADLSRQAAGKLGSQAQDRDFRPRSGNARGQGQLLAPALSARRRRHAGRRARPYRGCDDAARNAACRHGGGGLPVGRALCERGRKACRPADYGTPCPHRGGRTCRSRTGIGRGQDHAGPRFQRFRSGQARRDRGGRHAEHVRCGRACLPDFGRAGA